MAKDYHFKEHKTMPMGYNTDNTRSNRRQQEIEELEKEIAEEEARLSQPESDDELVVELEDASEELKEGGDPVVEEESPPKKAQESNDSTDWKKRYGDLRTHLNEKEKEWSEKFTALEQKIAEVPQEGILPETMGMDDLKELLTTYPQISSMMQTLIAENNEGMKKEIAELQRDKAKVAFDRAYNKLLKKHPDFDDLRQTDEFKNWLADQPSIIQDSINKPSLDDDGVKAAVRTVDFFKKEVGPSSKEDTQDEPSDAGKKVKTGDKVTPATQSNEVTFSESQVANMDDREFARLAPEIEKAQREGRFDYDLQAAR